MLHAWLKNDMDSNEMNEDLYRIIDNGLRVTRVVGVSDDFASSYLDAVTLHFGHLYVHMEADDEDDSLVLRVGETGGSVENLSRFQDPQSEARDLSGALHWSEIIAKRIRWFWELKNHQGYLDGAQFQFFGEQTEDDKTLQFVGMANFVEVSFVDQIVKHVPRKNAST